LQNNKQRFQQRSQKDQKFRINQLLKFLWTTVVFKV
jgi:hypothetical protein